MPLDSAGISAAILKNYFACGRKFLKKMKIGQIERLLTYWYSISCITMQSINSRDLIGSKRSRELTILHIVWFPDVTLLTLHGVMSHVCVFVYDVNTSY